MLTRKNAFKKLSGGFFKEILECDSEDDGRSASLGSTTPPDSPVPVPDNVDIFIELTLNHPRNTRFNNMTSDMQKKLYDKIFSAMTETRPLPLCGMKVERVFEYCKTGHVHLHANITYTLPKGKYYPMGIVGDLAKRYLRLIKQVYQEKNCYPEFNRYRCPSIVVQYNEDVKRRDVWLAYMHKASYNN